MVDAVLYLYLIIGVLIYMRKREWFPFYIIGMSWLLPFCVNYIYPCIEKEYLKLMFGANYLLGICIVLRSFDFQSIDCKKLYIGIVCFLLYALLLAHIRGVSYLTFCQYAYNSMIGIVLFLLITPVKPQQVYSFLFAILSFEVVFGYFQMFGYFTLPYQTGFKLGMLNNSITGTYAKGVYYGDSIAMMLLVLLLIKTKLNRRLEPKDYILMVSTIGIVFATGVRTPFVILAIFTPLIILHSYKYNRKMILCIIGLIMLLGLLAYSVAENYVVDRLSENSSERQAELIKLLNGTNTITDTSTVSISFFMLSYLLINPLLGPGLLFTSPHGYGGWIHLTSGYITDVTLMLHICEFGLIGLLLYSFCLRSVITFRKQDRMHWLVLLPIILITITDAGLTNITMCIYTFLYYKLDFDNASQTIIRQQRIPHKGES